MANQETPVEDDLSPDAEALAGAEEMPDHDPDQLLLDLQDAKAKADEHWNQCLRLQAEMDNLRKRSERDLANAHKFALEKFAEGLLPVLDSLEMGLSHGKEEGAELAKLLEGTELTLKQLSQVMSKFGVQAIDPVGQPFNPEFHEAMVMQPAPEGMDSNTVMTVFQKGYTLNGRLVRPAKVIVAQ
ncbi:MAG: nucleotide exchange factor GrpE [Gammaproteobacteria bacterium]|nr:nucleotide exchange factor GrpE [Gammaproteobacteria bacterium]MCP5137704.1 nucleotide exchange factor GrpE [Gammaproteobacteria bacterium]